MSLSTVEMQRSPTDSGDTKEEKETPTQIVPKPTKKFHNGWTRQLENLAAEWADKASCYQWMHQKTEVRYQKFNYYFTIPVIVMSTLTGTANFATNSIVSTEEQAKLVTFGVGAISIIAGIISTVANFLRYAQGSEAHRVAAISWGKFQRFISIELALHPNERMDAMSFLKMGRIELDRLIEQSPPIPVKTIEQFQETFSQKKDIQRPEIVGGIEHTRIFDDRDSRMAKLAAEAAYMIQQKKGLMRQLVMEDIDKRIVSRAQDERATIEEDLRRELLLSAQEVARITVKEALMKSAVPTKQGPFVPKKEVDQIPTGVVGRVKQTIQRRLSLVGTTTRPLTLAEAAAAVGAIRQAPPAPHSPVRLEIDDREEADLAAKAAAYSNL